MLTHVLYQLMKLCINAKHSFSWQGSLLLNFLGDKIINQDFPIINLLCSERLENFDLTMTSSFLHLEL